MKHLLLLASILLAAFSANAQTNIKLFDNIGKQAITELLGNPSETWSETDFDGFPILLANSKKVNICIDLKNRLSWFATKSPSFYILPEVVPGGIKVGDSISKLKNIDFIHSPYGQGKSGNGLSRENVGDKTLYYIYQEEYDFIVLEVDNGIITKLEFRTVDENFTITPKRLFDY
jgi:hypothetical protein